MEMIVSEIGLNDAVIGLLGTCKRSPKCRRNENEDKHSRLPKKVRIFRAVSTILARLKDKHMNAACYLSCLLRADLCVLSREVWRCLHSITCMLNAGARSIAGLRRSAHITDTLASFHWLRAPEWIEFKLAVIVYRALHYMSETASFNIRLISWAALYWHALVESTLVVSCQSPCCTPVGSCYSWWTIIIHSLLHFLPSHGSSSSSPSSLEPHASSLTRSVFHSELKT